MDDITPLNHGDNFGVGQRFGQLVDDNPRFAQSVEIEVVNLLGTAILIKVADSKGRARYPVAAAKTGGQTADKGCLTTAQIREQLDDYWWVQ